MSGTNFGNLNPITTALATDEAIIRRVGVNTEFRMQLAAMQLAAMSGLSFQRNKIINGGMMIDQRNNGGSVTIPNGSGASVDKWRGVGTQASKFSLQQQALAAGSGPTSSFYLKATSLSAATVASTDRFVIIQGIEAQNLQELMFGTAAALPIALSFWVNSSQGGTIAGAIQNYTNTRSYPFLTPSLTANTWTKVSVLIPADTAGTWVLTGNSGGMLVIISLGCGTTLTATAGSWQTGNFQNATGGVSVVGTNAATLEITDVQLETGPISNGFEQRLVGQELALCQRYCYVMTNGGAAGAPFCQGTATGATGAIVQLRLPVSLRASGGSLIVTSTAADWAMLTANGGSQVCNAAPSLSRVTTEIVEIACSTASGLVAGNATALYANATANLQLGIAADL